MTDLGDKLARLEVAIDQAMHEFLTALRQFDATGGWRADGATSCVQWLSWRIGLGPGVARERLRVARALAELPAIDAALASGELSYSKVRAITRVACPDSEEILLGSARAATTAQLEKLCAALRRGQASAEVGAEGEAAAAEPERFFRQRTTDDGMVRLTIQLTADEAATVTRALDVSAETPNRRAEGLVALAEEALRGKLRDRTPTEVVVHVDAEALGDVAGTSDQGVVLSRETCRRLLCDAGIVPVLTDQRGRTLDIGRKTRSIPTAIRRAMVLRDGGCRFPGCDHQIVAGHHIEHWGDGGETKLDNLVSLCHAHHRLVHERGATIVCVDHEGEIDFDFYSADGRLLPLVPPRPLRQPPLAFKHLDPWTATATGDRVPIDWPWAIDATAGAIARARKAGGSRLS